MFLALQINFFERLLHQLIVIGLSCIPIIESRYAIVIGDMAYPEIGYVELFILSQLGAFFITLLLLLLLKPIFKWMKSTKVFRRLVEWLEEHGKKKGAKLEKRMADSKSEKAKIWASVIGVFLFVAIPLPGTGVWTGSLVASILNIRFKYAFPTICAGSVVATLIMMTFSSVFMQVPTWLQ